MTDLHYDLAVIGSGPAGESAAMNAAKHNKSVVVIDSQQQVGGNCTHKGTIPSKALRHSVHSVMKFNKNKMFRAVSKPIWMTFPQVLESAKGVINEQVQMRSRFYGRNRIEVIEGSAQFVNKDELLIQGGEHHNSRIFAKHVVIAVGSRPYRPPGVDFSHPRVFDSDTILFLKETLKKLLFLAPVLSVVNMLQFLVVWVAKWTWSIQVSPYWRLWMKRSLMP